MDSSSLPAIVLIVAGVGLVAMLVLQALQISQLRQRLEMLTRGADGRSLEGVLDAHLELVHQVSEDLDDLTARTARLEVLSSHHLAHVGLVRFNPFPDTGGNQSFALAMLDEAGNGFIVSSLHSRTGTRIYAKSVAGGKAEATLSAEENQAVDLAKASRSGRPAEAELRPAAPRPREIGPAAAPAFIGGSQADLSLGGSVDGLAPEAESVLPAAPDGAAAQESAASAAASAGAMVAERYVSVVPVLEPVSAASGAEDAAAVPGARRSRARGAVGRSIEPDHPARPEPVAESGDFKEPTVAVEGQSKGDAPASADDGAAESERTGRRPARLR